MRRWRSTSRLVPSEYNKRVMVSWCNSLSKRSHGRRKLLAHSVSLCDRLDTSDGVGVSSSNDLDCTVSMSSDREWLRDA
jgi:hypothetical protein